MNKPYYAIVQTPYGNVLICVLGVNVVAFLFIDYNREHMISVFKKHFPDALLNQNYNFFPIISDILSHKKVPFKMHGTPFQNEVWNAVHKLTSVTSYQELANRIGKKTAVRAVSSAVANNMLHYIIPCHLVIRSDGTIGEYAGGTELKRRLINAH